MANYRLRNYIQNIYSAKDTCWKYKNCTFKLIVQLSSVAQLCPTLCDPMKLIREGQKTQLKESAVVVQLLGHSQLFCNPMDWSPSGSSILGFPRQVYWSELPSSSPGDLPDPGIEPTSLMSPALTPEKPFLRVSRNR